jgi:hypothetical protein
MTTHHLLTLILFCASAVAGLDSALSIDAFNTQSSGAPNAAGGTAPLCQELFFLSVPESLRTQTARLAPELSYDKSSLESLYISLVQEDFRSASRTLEELRSLEIFADRYNLPERLPELQLFYSNALASLYSRAAWEWKKQEVEKIIGAPLAGGTLLTAQALMDSFYTVRGFGERPESIAGVSEFFARKTWLEFNWPSALEVARRWQSSPEFAQGFSGFHRWFEKQKDLPALSFEDLQRLFLALTKKPSPVVCCKSSYACSSCPHNRAWLKKAED